MDFQKILLDLEEVYGATFGYVGSEPDVYHDYDRLCELDKKMREGITDLHNFYSYLRTITGGSNVTNS